MDLHEEISKLKRTIVTEDLISTVTADAVNNTVEKILSIIDKYDFIEVPKTIKLSEIMDKLYNDGVNIEIGKSFKDQKALGVSGYDRYFDDYIFDELIVFNDNMEIEYIGLDLQKYKWLYKLAVGKTIIINDMEGN